MALHTLVRVEVDGKVVATGGVLQVTRSSSEPEGPGLLRWAVDVKGVNPDTEEMLVRLLVGGAKAALFVETDRGYVFEGQAYVVHVDPDDNVLVKGTGALRLVERRAVR